MNIPDTLAHLATEHLEQMRLVPWHALARAVAKRFPSNAGEAFGCEVEGLYLDVGDTSVWANEPDGDIVLTAYASTDPAGERTVTVQRSALIVKPSILS